MVLTKDLDGAGTVTHQAPELLREGDKAGASVDMFALGIMVRGAGVTGRRDHRLLGCGPVYSSDQGQTAACGIHAIRSNPV